MIFLMYKTSEILASIEAKRKEVFYNNQTLKLYAEDELTYIQDAKEKVATLNEELQSNCTKLATIHIEFLKRFPIHTNKATSSRRKKENRKKLEKKKKKDSSKELVFCQEILLPSKSPPRFLIPLKKANLLLHLSK